MTDSVTKTFLGVGVAAAIAAASFSFVGTTQTTNPAGYRVGMLDFTTQGIMWPDSTPTPNAAKAKDLAINAAYKAKNQFAVGTQADYERVRREVQQSVMDLSLSGACSGTWTFRVVNDIYVRVTYFDEARCAPGTGGHMPDL